MVCIRLVIATVKHAQWLVNVIVKMLLVGPCDFFDDSSQCVVAGVIVGIGFSRRLQRSRGRKSIDFQTKVRCLGMSY